MRRLAWSWLLLVGGIALLAPLIANDAPLLARVDGELRFPALAAYIRGRSSAGPHADSAQTWQQWWVRLDDTSPGGDWAVMPPWPYGPLMERDPGRRHEPPSPAHPLGTDSLGRDVLSRLIWGTGTAVRIGLGAVALALLLGVPLGALAGLAGGLADAVVSVLVEIFMCFPPLFLVLAVAALVGESTLAVIAVLGLVYWTSIARIVRGELLSLREREFVLAARGLGVGRTRLLLRHLLPGLAGPVAVNAAFLFAAAVIVEATLSFLGLSPSGGGDSWGTLLAEGKASAVRGVWHLWLFPTLVVGLTVTSLHGLAGTPRRRRTA